MHSEHINHAFLDGVLSGAHTDCYYHFGITSDDPIMERFREVRAVVMAGSGDRIKQFAVDWSRDHGNAEIISLK